MNYTSDLANTLFSRSPRYFAGGMYPNDFLEVLEKTRTWDDWVSGVLYYADERLRLANEALSKGRTLSAGEYFIEAGIYYHYSVLNYFEDPDKKVAIRKKSVEIYAKGMGLIDRPIRRIDIPYDGITMAAHLRLPESGPGPFPLVILLPGVDSVKEEYFEFSKVFIERGLATMALEGPGQGETRYQRPLIDYENAFSAVMDYLEDVKEIDKNAIGLYGRSMGGHLGPKLAAHDKRLRALVSAGGIYDMKYWDRLSDSVKNNFTHAWGYTSLNEARAYATNGMTLEGVIEKIECPFLVVHSEQDRSFPAEGGRRMVSEAKCEAELVIYEEGFHCADNIRYKYQRLVADWLREKLI